MLTSICLSIHHVTYWQQHVAVLPNNAYLCMCRQTVSELMALHLLQHQSMLPAVKPVPTAQSSLLYCTRPGARLFISVAELDPAMLNRAGRRLAAAFEHT